MAEAMPSTNPTTVKPLRPWRRILSLRLLMALLVTLGVAVVTWLGIRNHKNDMLVAEIQSVGGGAGADTDSERKPGRYPPLVVAARAGAEMGLEARVFLRVFERMYHDDKWKTVGEIIVYADGQYRRSVIDMGDEKSTLAEARGRIPDSVMRVLKDEVSKNSAFKIIEGIPTYKFGIDNHRVQHPGGVSELLELSAFPDDE